MEEVTKKLKNVRGMGELNILCITGIAGSGSPRSLPLFTSGFNRSLLAVFSFPLDRSGTW
jgi:hypothetical protein